MEQLEYEQIIRFRKEEYNRNGFNALEISRDELQKLTGSRKADALSLKRQCASACWKATGQMKQTASWLPTIAITWDRTEERCTD